NDKIESNKPIEEPIVKPDNQQPEPNPTPVPPEEVVDYQALQQVLFYAENIDGSAYLATSYQALQTEISIGQQMLNAQNSSQSEVNAQTMRIQQAINSLVPKGNKASLAEAIEKAQSINLELYTIASVENFNRVYAQALAVYNEQELTQQDIDSQVSELNHAMDQLVKRGDKTELQALLEKTKQVDRQIYTVESLQALDEAI
ncbi:FIVAR domain-containing protein, partial [Enterococcus faecium]|nr:FIVAR domain-containing protein [Enterococcus faecium]